MGPRRAGPALIAIAWVMLAARGGVHREPAALTPTSSAASGGEISLPIVRPVATCKPGWSIVASPNAGTLDNYLQAVAAVSASDAWAVGASGARGARQTLVEHWNGNDWSIVPSPNVAPADNYLQAVAVVSRDDVWAVGSAGDNALVLHWDGNLWTIVPAAGGVTGGSYLTGVAAVSANEVWAAGYYQDGLAFRTLVERWDGSTWNVVPSANVDAANNELLGITAHSTTDIWTAGNYAKNTVLQTLAEHWDGTQWTIVQSPNTGPWASFSSIAAVSNTDVWAVGAHSEKSPFKPLLEHWDGGQWSIAPGADVGDGAILSSLSATSADNIWAVGASLQTGSVVIERWDGTQWTVSPGANNKGSNSLTGVTALTGGDVWAVGSYQDPGGMLERTLAERYTGPCPTPTATPTATPTMTATPTNTPTATATATLCALTFSDVQPQDYFYEPVRRLYCGGAISGYGDNTFRPGNLTIRGQLSKIVVLAEGWTIYTPTSPTFRDVDATNTFYAYIETAYHRGIVSGYGCGAGCLEFRPVNNLTRGELCKIVVLAQGWPLYAPPTSTFRDVPTTDPFYAHIEIAYSKGIISGYTCGAGCLEFHPGNNATRGQIAKIVYLAVTAPYQRMGGVP
jgi:hypothetical protein